MIAHNNQPNWYHYPNYFAPAFTFANRKIGVVVRFTNQTP
jgi:hypothetical protein